MANTGVNDPAVISQILSEAESLLPVATLALEVDAGALVDDSPARAALFDQLTEAMSATLDIDVAAIEVTGIRARPTNDDSGRRRTQQTEAEFDFTIKSDNPERVFTTLNEQLQDPSSTLRTSENFAIDATVGLSVSFTCPKGLYRPEGAKDCQKCIGGTIPDPEDNSKCGKCPDSTRQRVDPSTGQCVCMAGYYDSWLKSDAHYDPLYCPPGTNCELFSGSIGDPRDQMPTASPFGDSRLRSITCWKNDHTSGSVRPEADELNKQSMNDIAAKDSSGWYSGCVRCPDCVDCGSTEAAEMNTAPRAWGAIETRPTFGVRKEAEFVNSKIIATDIVVFKCTNEGGSVCLGEKNFSSMDLDPHSCKTGYDEKPEAPFCATCDESWSMANGECVDCSTSTYFSYALRLGGFVVLAVSSRKPSLFFCFCCQRSAWMTSNFWVVSHSWARQVAGVVAVQQFKARLEYSAAVLKIAWPRFKQCIALLITNYQVRRAASCAGFREEQEGQREKSARTSCVVCAYRSCRYASQ